MGWWLAGIGTAALLLASATASDAREVARLVASAAEARLANEAVQSAQIRALTPTDAVRRREDQVMAAWRTWYAEALESVLRLPVDGPDERLRSEISTRAARLRRR